MRRHSAIALIALAILAFMAYLRQWQIPWLYYIAATVLYSCTVIFVLLVMETWNEKEPSVAQAQIPEASHSVRMDGWTEKEHSQAVYVLRSVNFFLMALIILEWILPTKPAPTIAAVLLLKFILGIVVGFGLSATFDIIPQLRNGENVHGWLGVAVLLYALMVPIARAWIIPWLYYTIIMAIYCGLIVLWRWTPDEQTYPPLAFLDKKVIRFLWGVYLVMLFWVSIILFDLSYFTWAHFLGVLILAIPVCFAVSFLLSILIGEEKPPMATNRAR